MKRAAYRRIKLNNDYVLLIDAVDWQKFKHIYWFAAPHHTGTFYVRCSVHMKKRYGFTTQALHRLIMNAQKGQLVDHANRKTLDCRRSNLRFGSPTQNSLNRKKVSGTSIYKGVHFDKESGKWRAKFRRKNLGRYSTQEEAAREYNRAAKAYDAQFTRRNKIR